MNQKYKQKKTETVMKVAERRTKRKSTGKGKQKQYVIDQSYIRIGCLNKKNFERVKQNQKHNRTRKTKTKTNKQIKTNKNQKYRKFITFICSPLCGSSVSCLIIIIGQSIMIMWL